jgi:hypothetical protein
VAFALFGIGDYAFAPWKVAVSGLHRHSRFQVVGPIRGKPVFLDDTCYYLPFRQESDARLVADILNSAPCKAFLQSLTFTGVKRSVTVELLQRLILSAIAEEAGFGLRWRALDRADYRLSQDVPQLELVMEAARQTAKGALLSADSYLTGAEAVWFGPATPDVFAVYGDGVGGYVPPLAFTSHNDVIDADKNIYFAMSPDRVEFWHDTVLIWCMRQIEETTAALYTVFDLSTGAAAMGNSAGMAAIDLDDWTSGNKVLYIVVRGVRVAKIDVTNSRISLCGSLDQIAAIITTLSDSPAWTRWNATCFQAWLPKPGRYNTQASASTAGTLVTQLWWNQQATQAGCL